jgi:hypothetical protein
MRVHYEVWTPAFFTERHVFLRDDKSTDTFLAVSGTEFVSEFGSADLTEDVFDDQLVFGVGG